MQAVLFDLDDTLLVDEAISAEAMDETARLAARLHEADVPKFLASARRIAKEFWRANPCLDYCERIGISFEECLWGRFEGASADLRALREWAGVQRTRFFEAILREQGLAGEEDSLAGCFADSRRSLQRLMPDTLETLALLKPRFKIGLLTNGAPDLQREKIASSGLSPFLDAIAISGEHDIGKPDPRIFHTLLSQLETPAQQAAMVGNSLARDVRGARSAGLAKAIWLKVPGSEEFAEVMPDHTICGLHELPGIL